MLKPHFWKIGRQQQGRVILRQKIHSGKSERYCCIIQRTHALLFQGFVSTEGSHFASLEEVAADVSAQPLANANAALLELVEELHFQSVFLA